MEECAAAKGVSRMGKKTFGAPRNGTFTARLRDQTADC
jgi:hypothetical protein